MSTSPLVAVHIPELGDPRLKSWAKAVTYVDEAKSSGWAFEGEFVATGGIQDVPVGSVLVVYGERGSRAQPRPCAALFRVNADGTLSLEAEAAGKAWARTLRDRAAEMLATAPVLAPSRLDLSSASDEELLAELRRRRLL
jgi:hypothetical protein